MPGVRVHDRIHKVPRDQWDALDHQGSPFTRHAWLEALEETGCAVEDEGWVPRHLTVEDADGRVIAAAPAYVKLHSMGEFVYDWAWAGGARQLGVPYYPKLVVGVPFTPAAGPRLLTRPGEDRAALVELLVGGLHELARLTRCAGVHVLFDTPEEVARMEGMGALTRTQLQLHWTDEGYQSFDGFLDAFQSKRRKAIRRERRQVAEAGVQVEVLAGDALEPGHLEAMEGFYRRTCMRYGGETYLKPAFWDEALARLRPSLHLTLAREGGRPIAGALSVLGERRLYGRYWGSAAELDGLHFEVCYYRPIEDCLARGLQVFEPGHGGGHKYPRGFEPQTTWSSHWLFEPRLAGPVARFLAEEREQVRLRAEAMLADSALRRKVSEGCAR